LVNIKREKRIGVHDAIALLAGEVWQLKFKIARHRVPLQKRSWYQIVKGKGDSKDEVEEKQMSQDETIGIRQSALDRSKKTIEDVTTETMCPGLLFSFLAWSLKNFGHL